MARKATIKVVGYPAYRKGVRYRVVVFHIERNRSELVIRLRHLDLQQYGREHEITLPLPARPTGRTADFLQACRQSVAIDAEIVLSELVGTIINVSLGDGCANEPQDCSFFPAYKEPDHDPVAL